MAGQYHFDLADGACQPDQVYPIGGGVSIQLQFPASVVQVGLKSPGVWESMKPEVGDRSGPSIGKIRRIIKSTIRLANSLGIKIGRSRGTLVEAKLRDPFVPNDNPPSVFTGDTPRDTFNGDWDRRRATGWWWRTSRCP